MGDSVVALLVVLGLVAAFVGGAVAGWKAHAESVEINACAKRCAPAVSVYNAGACGCAVAP